MAELFRIDDGVRRAKAAEMTGKDAIPARIKRAGQPDEIRTVSIDSLRSPKTDLPLDSRFLDNNLKRAQQGSTPPPIEVVPLQKENPRLLPIRKVKLVPPVP